MSNKGKSLIEVVIVCTRSSQQHNLFPPFPPVGEREARPSSTPEVSIPTRSPPQRPPMSINPADL